MTMPFLAIFLYQERGIAPETIGLIIGISALTGTFGGFIGGYLSDRIGRFPVMILAIFAWSGVFLGFALAESVGTFLLLNALNGLCRSWFEPISRALLSDVTTKENRLSVFNARYFAINVGAAIGPVAGTYLGTSHSMSAFYITASVYFLYALLVCILMKKYQRSLHIEKEEKISIKRALATVAKDRVLFLFLLGNMVVLMAQAQMDTTLAQYTANSALFTNGVALFSYLIVANALTVLILQYPLTSYMKRFSPMFGLCVGSLAFSLALAGFGLSTNAFFLILSMVVLTVGEIIVYVNSDVLLDDLAPKHMKGTYFGAMSLRSIGFSVGPWIGGVLLQFFGFSHGFYVFGSLALLSLLALPFFQLGQHVKYKQDYSAKAVTSKSSSSS
ncbi:hypothetical protein A374_04991 [Fictibacillus macauensis ZFHKF-1]|uniref:Major facilitator superfamily (MFS) profile domain-containing protein n=2 Tax=Fictibacillus TaxID=1329200 RepID=I8AKB5_9BACL|nr:hypothetical protein A374_04991 [Fictibacillus macauensis ZFHKF-1]